MIKRLSYLDKKCKSNLSNFKNDRCSTFLTIDESMEYDFLKYINCFKSNELVPFISNDGVPQKVEFYTSNVKTINHNNGVSTYINRDYKYINIKSILYDEIINDDNFYKKVTRSKSNFIFPHHFEII